MSKQNFGKHQPSLIALAILILGIKPIGRYELSKYVNQTLAKTRSLLNILVKNNIAYTEGQSSGTRGTSLTKSGHRLYNTFSKYVQLYLNPDLGELITDLIPQNSQYTMLFFNSDTAKVSGLFERDLAVRNGANGAISLIRNNDIWQFPDGFQLSNQFSENFEASNLFNSCILVFSTEIAYACAGAIAIADYHLYEEIIKLLSDYF